MAEYWYNNGQSASSLGMVGYTGSNRYVVVYPFTVGSGGCNSVTVSLSNFYSFLPTTGGNTQLSIKIATFPSQYSAGTATPDATIDMSYGSSWGGSRTFSKNLTAGTYYVTIYNSGSAGYWTTVYSGAGSVSTSGSYNPTVVPTLKSISESVETQNNVLIVMNNPSSVSLKAYFSYSGTALETSSAFTSQLSYTCPRSWFSNNTSVTEMSISVEIKKADGTAISPEITTSFMLNADSDMRPVLYDTESETPSFTASNVKPTGGTINEYISNLSKVQIEFSRSNDNYVADMSNTAGAVIRTVWIEYNGVSTTTAETGYPYRYITGAITGSGYVRVWMQDSRERTAYYDYTFTAYAYTAPRLTSAEVIRCDTSGTASDSGTRYKVKVTGESTTIGNNANARTITCYSKKTSDTDYGTGTVVTESSSTFTILETVLDASSTYMVKIEVSDAAGGSQEYIYYLSFEKWMICWTATGNGCGIGQAPDQDNMLQIPNTWEFNAGSARFGHNRMVLVDDKHYGTQSEMAAVSNPVEGQIFYVLPD